jgi:hypothetical protein
MWSHGRRWTRVTTLQITNGGKRSSFRGAAEAGRLRHGRRPMRKHNSSTTLFSGYNSRSSCWRVTYGFVSIRRWNGYSAHAIFENNEPAFRQHADKRTCDSLVHLPAEFVISLTRLCLFSLYTSNVDDEFAPVALNACSNKTMMRRSNAY